VNAHIQGGRARQAAWLALLGFVSVATGCAWGDHRPKVEMDSAAGLYDSARLEYKLDAGQLNLPLAVTRVEGQLVSYDQVPSTPTRDTSVGTLKIEYPHPEGRPGFARARLEITSKASGAAPATPESTSSWSKVAKSMNPKRLWTSSAKTQIDETWEFDVPREQLDMAVASLNRAGYFDARQQGSDGVELEAVVDGKTVKKTWHQVPELNELMLSVRNQGRLVAYTRPAADRTSAATTANLAHYQHYEAQDRLAAQTAATPTWQAAPGANPAPTLPSYAATPQTAGAPPVVPYYPESPAMNPAPTGVLTAANTPSSAATAGNVSPAVGWQAPPTLPREDSVPWRAGSRPAPTMPELQPPGTYPATPYGPAATPNVASQPAYPTTPY